MAAKKATAKPADAVEQEAADATKQDEAVAGDKPATEPVPPVSDQNQANEEKADTVVLVVNRERLEHDGLPYGMGAPIELTADQAKPLLAIGAVRFDEVD